MTVPSKLLNIPMEQDPGFVTQLSYSVDALSKEWVWSFFPQPGRIKDTAPGTAASFPVTQLGAPLQMVIIWLHDPIRYHGG